VTSADPILIPFTFGGADGANAPCEMKIFIGVTVTLEVSLLVSVMKTPPDGAGFVKVTWNGAESPGATVTLAGTRMSLTTVTLALVLAMFGALAEIVADPAPTPVTGTFTLIAPAANIRVAGTVATPVLLELRLTVKPPAGACPPVRFNVRFPVLPALIVRLAGVKLIVGADTVTVPLPDV
jgi:hypothetical protein